MNQYVKSVEAALRATAPYVAIPVEGHAPACVKAKLLKGALKGVSIHSVKIITADPKTTEDSGRWLQIKGRAEGGVQTSCKIVVANIKNYAVWKALREWTDREREKRIKIVSQGALNPAERKALKLKEAMAKEEKRRNAELIAAQREEAEILDEARESVFPVLTPKDEDERAKIVAEYAEFRRSLPNRKRGSVIRWRLKQLREQVKAMTVEKREYEEKPSSGWHRRRRSLVRVTKVLRRKKDTLKYAAAVYQIGQLEAQYNKLYPAKWRAWACGPVEEGNCGYWVDSFIEKRPKGQAYTVPWNWNDGCVPVVEQSDEEENPYPIGLKLLAVRLRNARANIRSLTPPADEEDELPLAA